MGRIVVIGDVGGHADQLRWALQLIEAEEVIPPDVTVIQVGDLVHRGPQSSHVLAMVARYLRDQPRQWIQLIGNHEAHYLPGGQAFWLDPISDMDARVLRDWWHARQMRVAAAVATNDGDEFLITHAGLTVGSWRELGEPMTAAGAALMLNDRPEPLLWRGGQTALDDEAGPLWAESGGELHEPWMEHFSLGGFVPFGQIHGHSVPFRYLDQTWRVPERVRLRATVDIGARHCRVRIGGRQFIAIDPKHGRNGAPRWQPLMLAGQVLQP